MKRDVDSDSSRKDLDSLVGEALKHMESLVSLRQTCARGIFSGASHRYVIPPVP